MALSNRRVVVDPLLSNLQVMSLTISTIESLQTIRCLKIPYKLETADSNLNF